MYTITHFAAFLKIIRRYFKGYGGWRAILYSPIFIIALVISGLNYPNWIEPKWIERAFGAIPNLLGFSLGSYTILFGVMTGRLKRSLKAVKNERGISYLEEINSTFFHFVLVQVICLVWGLIFEGTIVSGIFNYFLVNCKEEVVILQVITALGSLTGHVLLVYSFLLILAAAIAVYRIASITDPEDG